VLAFQPHPMHGRDVVLRHAGITEVCESIMLERLRASDVMLDMWGGAANPSLQHAHVEPGGSATMPGKRRVSGSGVKAQVTLLMFELWQSLPLGGSGPR